MHSTEIPNGSVPAFLTKLWRLVEDPKYDDLIGWTSNGESFIIHQQSRFAKELLPLYFKHNNMASFIRQLNMYGFRKVVKIEQVGLHLDTDVEFFHQFFLKEQESLLIFIKRKVAVSRTTPDETKPTTLKSEIVEEIMTDVKAIRGKQENVDNLLNNMKRENEALWREVAMLRQKHFKQQQIVEKLIQFLVTLVQPNGVNMGAVKRKVPLLLYNNSTSGVAPDNKIPRLSRHISATAGNPNNSTTGPVIHDVTDALDPKPLLSNDANEKFNADSLLADNLLSNSNDAPPDNQSFTMNSVESTTSLQSPSPDMDPLIDSPGPAVGSPLGTEDTMEPLSVLVPLETPPEDLVNTDLFLSPCPIEMNSNITQRPTGLELDCSAESKLLNNESLNTPQVDLESFISIPSTSNSKANASSSQDEDKQNEQITLFSEDNKMQVAISDPSNISNLRYRKRNLSECERSQFADHLEGIESELDWLQDQLSGSSFNFDVSNLLTLFGSDDTVPGNNLSADSLKFMSGEVTGNEVVQYLPTLQDFELMEGDSNDAHVFTTASNPNLGASTSSSSGVSGDPIADLLNAASSNNNNINSTLLKNPSSKNINGSSKLKRNLDASLTKLNRKKQ